MNHSQVPSATHFALQSSIVIPDSGGAVCSTCESPHSRRVDPICSYAGRGAHLLGLTAIYFVLSGKFKKFPSMSLVSKSITSPAYSLYVINAATLPPDDTIIQSGVPSVPMTGTHTSPVSAKPPPYTSFIHCLASKPRQSPRMLSITLINRFDFELPPGSSHIINHDQIIVSDSSLLVPLSRFQIKWSAKMWRLGPSLDCLGFEAAFHGRITYQHRAFTGWSMLVT